MIVVPVVPCVSVETGGAGVVTSTCVLLSALLDVASVVRPTVIDEVEVAFCSTDALFVVDESVETSVDVAVSVVFVTASLDTAAVVVVVRGDAVTPVGEAVTPDEVVDVSTVTVVSVVSVVVVPSTSVVDSLSVSCVEFSVLILGSVVESVSFLPGTRVVSPLGAVLVMFGVPDVVVPWKDFVVAGPGVVVTSGTLHAS